MATAVTDAHALDRKRQLRLTTRGRKSGQPRTVTIWFVAPDARRVLVQHVSRKPAQWFRNLQQDPNVTVDFGDGPIARRALPITDADQIREVLRLIGRKYRLAWLIRLLGWGSQPVAAELTLPPA